MDKALLEKQVKHLKKRIDKAVTHLNENPTDRVMIAKYKATQFTFNSLINKYKLELQKSKPGMTLDEVLQTLE